MRREKWRLRRRDRCRGRKMREKGRERWTAEWQCCHTSLSQLGRGVERGCQSWRFFTVPTHRHRHLYFVTKITVTVTLILHQKIPWPSHPPYQKLPSPSPSSVPKIDVTVTLILHLNYRHRHLHSLPKITITVTMSLQKTFTLCAKIPVSRCINFEIQVVFLRAKHYNTQLAQTKWCGESQHTL